jgi:hypothetical protein
MNSKITNVLEKFPLYVVQNSATIRVIDSEEKFNTIFAEICEDRFKAHLPTVSWGKGLWEGFQAHVTFPKYSEATNRHQAGVYMESSSSKVLEDEESAIRRCSYFLFHVLVDLTKWSKEKYYFAADLKGANSFLGVFSIHNLTPHDINLIGENGELVQTFKSEGSARCVATRQKVATLNGLPINKVGFGETVDLPDFDYDIFYIVSRIVADANPERSDLLIVDDTVRNEQGQIIGCKSFSQIKLSKDLRYC